MGWKESLITELETRIKSIGGSVYLIYDDNGGIRKSGQVNTRKRDWQDEFITELSKTGITITKSTWDRGTFMDRGILLTFFAMKIFQEQRFIDMISKEAGIRWIVCVWDVPISEDMYPENFVLDSEGHIQEADGGIKYMIFRRTKVNV